MISWITYCSVCVLVLSGVLADKTVPFSDTDSLATLIELVKNELDKRWSNIFAEMQQKIDFQERRIKHLENRDSRRESISNRLATTVVELQKKYESMEHAFVTITKPEDVKNDSDYTQFDKRVGLTEHVNYGIHDVDHSRGNVSDTRGKRHTTTNQSIDTRNKRHKTTNQSTNFRDKRQTTTNQIIDARDKRHPVTNQAFVRQAIRPSSHHVAFTAYLDHNVAAMGPGHTIKMNQGLLNDGLAYNQHTGVFTAPETGVYLFNFHFSSRYSFTWIKLVVDSVEIVDADASPHSSFEAMGGNSVVLGVGAGQSVWLEDHSNGGEMHAGPATRFCTFSGVLLYN